MKHLLTLAFLFSFLCGASQEKPTKQQTIDFIQAWFENHTATRYSKVYQNRQLFFDGQFEFIAPSTARISYKSDEGMLEEAPKIVLYRFEVDLSKIESVGGERVLKQWYKMQFIPVNKADLIRQVSPQQRMVNNLYVPLNYTGEELDDEEMKIRKAFDHLRKLCGAPEPISFD